MCLTNRVHFIWFDVSTLNAKASYLFGCRLWNSIQLIRCDRRQYIIRSSANCKGFSIQHNRSNRLQFIYGFFKLYVLCSQWCPEARPHIHGAIICARSTRTASYFVYFIRNLSLKVYIGAVWDFISSLICFVFPSRCQKENTKRPL